MSNKFQVSMASEHIEENFKAYIEALALHRSADLGELLLWGFCVSILCLYIQL